MIFGIKEESIEKLLKSLDVSYIREYTFNDLVSDNGTKLRFDFAIFNNNILKYLIEYNGEQHYSPVDFYGGEEELKKQQYRDNLKINYCKNNNIPLLILNKESNIENEIKIKIISNGGEE